MRTPADPNKTDIIQKYLARRANSTALEAVRGIKRETGVDVSVGLVAKVKREGAAAPVAQVATATKTPVKKRRRRRRAVVVETVASTLTIESLLAAKKLANQLGGVEVAKTAVDALAKLG